MLRGSYGHKIADAVEQAKIAASMGRDADIDLSYIESMLAASRNQAQMAQILDAMIGKIVDTAAQCVTQSGLACTS